MVTYRPEHTHCIDVPMYGPFGADVGEIGSFYCRVRYRCTQGTKPTHDDPGSGPEIDVHGVDFAHPDSPPLVGARYWKGQWIAAPEWFADHVCEFINDDAETRLEMAADAADDDMAARDAYEESKADERRMAARGQP